MCGIAGIHVKRLRSVNKETLEKIVDRLLLNIEHRGRDATGMVAVKNKGKGVVFDKAPLRATLYVQRRPYLPNNVRTILLHTRYATQGLPTENENNHPVKYGTCFVTHNGHINNDDKLFTAHELERHAQVDTEIIPALIDKHGIDKIHHALKQLDGGFAIATVDPVRSPNALVLAKGPSSPLCFYDCEDFIVWASERKPIEEAMKAAGESVRWADMDSLDDGQMLFINTEKVEGFQFPLFREEKQKPLGFTPADACATRPAQPAQQPNTQPDTTPRCKGCHHTPGDHIQEGKCIGTNKRGEKKCNCRKFTPREAPGETKQDGADDKDPTAVVSHVGLKGQKYGVRRDGQLVNLETGQLGWPKEAAASYTEECGACGCQQSWHVGMTQTCEYPGCRCRKFDEKPHLRALPASTETIEAEVEEVQERCGGCNEWVPETEITVVYGWGICHACYSTWNEMGEEEGEGIESQTETESRAQQQAEELQWMRVCKIENERHYSCLRAVQANTGHTAEFVEWVLFRCPIEVLEENEWMRDVREAFDTAYANAEEAYLTTENTPVRAA